VGGPPAKPALGAGSVILGGSVRVVVVAAVMRSLTLAGVLVLGALTVVRLHATAAA
jgi:hypothetical protein